MPARDLPPHVAAAVARSLRRAPPVRSTPPAKKPRRVARAKKRKREDGYDSQLEADYAQRLDRMKLAGEIEDWWYKPVRLRLADGAWYTPDFRVQLASGEIEMHETKGWMREAARVRLLVAADRHPYRFVLVKREGGAWSVAEVGAAA